MTWTKISDDHFDREGVLSVSRSAALLDIEARVWCNRLLTDGRVSTSALGRLTTSPNPQGDIEELTAAGLWEPIDGGWQIDWTDQRPGDAVRAERAANRERQAAYAERGRRHRSGDHSACTDSCPQRANGITNGGTNGATNSATNSAPVLSRPDLSCPDRREGTGTGEGQGPSADPAAADAAPVASGAVLDTDGQPITDATGQPITPDHPAYSRVAGAVAFQRRNKGRAAS